ncbi:MAG: bacterial regulatory helix-turn-helix, lysR family protein [Holophagaceae bacterium]|nr:bacterial regulatory helix-turn-helix, lysR family protein [Holophagaceae bacterium]
MEAFAGHKFLSISREVAPALHDLAHGILDRAGVNCEVAMASENVLTSVGGVASGMGFALLPDYVEQILPPGTVTRPLDLPETPTIDLMVAYHRDDRLPALTCLLELLQERILEAPLGRQSPSL